MIGAVLQPVVFFFMVVFQITVMEFATIGGVGPDILFAFTVYAGLHIPTVRGTVISFLTGLVLDFLVSPIPGLHALLYVLSFSIAMAVGPRLNRESPLPAALLTGLLFFLQGCLIVFFYWLILDSGIAWTLPRVFFPQATVMGALSPFLYKFFDYMESLLHA